MTTIKLALDWFINSLHIGIIIAQEKNWFAESSISLSLVSPEMDNYATNTLQKLLQGEVDIAICPPELLIEAYQKSNRDYVAVATLLQPHATGFAIRTAAGTPRYADLQLPYETLIVQQVAKYAKLSIPQTVIVDKLDTWEAFKNKEAELCWGFQPWEGVEMETNNISGRWLPLHEAGIPYPNCPLIVCKKSWARQNSRLLKTFLHVISAGFYFARDHIREAIDILVKYIPQRAHFHEKMLFKSVVATNQFSLDIFEHWGTLQIPLFRQYLNWLGENGALYFQVDAEEMLTNEFVA
jgi:ABC-type nitrate/sulfonate/bicarbonate transport system substrate-binding protein